MANGHVEGIPTIDISTFTSNGDDKARQSTAKQLAELLRLHGCLAISGHGIPAESLDRAWTIMGKFFNLPYEEKMKAPHPEGFMPHRGYSGVNREHSRGKAIAETTDEAEIAKLSKINDYKETFEVGSEGNREQDNIWLPDSLLPEFRPFMVALYWQMTTVAVHFLEALMMSLNLPADECETLRKLHPGHENHLRLAHYLPPHEQKTRNEDGIRLAPHCDGGTFTLLFQKDQGGLEFRNRATGEWMPATPKPGYLYLNIGDIGERLSNGRYPSAKHRVVESGSRPINNVTTPERYSMPFFISPKGDTQVAPMPSLVTADGGSKYETFNMMEYTTQVNTALQNREKT